MITWKFNGNMNHQGVFHDMYVKGEYANSWVQRMSDAGTAWLFVDGMSRKDPVGNFPIRHTLAEAKNDGFVWWAAQQLEDMR
jgi:hypothetical protein